MKVRVEYQQCPVVLCVRHRGDIWGRCCSVVFDTHDHSPQNTRTHT